ncbi:hypothetical protein L0Y59_00120, partial [Candidatus Uhrbacteria bacterium]|nr:hypothetical protein [Candidatus Uhrbacteria bacterium]
ALNRTRVVRPLYAFAPAVVGAVILGFAAFHRRAVRKSFVTSSVLLLAAVAAATVASGLYVNRVGSIAYKYSINTLVSIRTSFNVAIDSYGFFSLGSAVVSIDHDKRHFPIQADVWVTTRSLYELSSALTQTELALPARTRRFVRTCGTEGTDLRLLATEDDRTFRIENAGARKAAAALLFVDGLFYEVPLVDGTLRDAFAFADLRHVSASSMTEQEFLLYTSCIDWLATSAGTWLLTYEESSDVSPGEEMPEKVSLVRIEIVEGERT